MSLLKEKLAKQQEIIQSLKQHLDEKSENNVQTLTLQDVVSPNDQCHEVDGQTPEINYTTEDKRMSEEEKGGSFKTANIVTNLIG